MQRCSLILWKCIALYYIHHLLGWKEVPALLTAVYKTESAQQMFYAAYNFCLPTLLFEIEKKKTWIWSGGGGMLNWFDSCQLLSNCWLKITWRYTICRLTGRFVPRFGRPQGLPHSSRGIGLRSIQGDGPEALWVFWSYNMGLAQLSSSSVSKRVCKKKKKRNEKKCWMNGRRWPRGSIVVMVESGDGRTKTKQRKKTRNMLLEGGWNTWQRDRK